MADENFQGAVGADQQAQFAIQKIYVKDISFEAPGTPMVFNEQGNPDLNLNLNQKVGKLADDVYEVILGINLTCKLGEKTVYIVELEQAGIFGLTGFDWLRDRWMKDDLLNKVRRMGALAAELGISQAELSIAWCLKNPNVTTAILGATRKEQLLQNLKALDALPLLTEEVMQRIEDIVQTKPVLPEH